MNNPIGVEYIVMELALGIGLDSKWFELTKQQQLTMATDVVDMESKLFAIPFSATGSIYFKDDLPPQMQTDLYLPGTADPNGDSETLCIGPIADYMFYHGKRAGVQLDCGPCALIRMREFWPMLPTDTKQCPINFTEEEVEKHHEDEAVWFKLNLLVNHWHDQMGGPKDRRRGRSIGGTRGANGIGSLNCTR
ncbi:hypothetical protein PHISP_02662 [Aspergillus sp. HF37]|nr:hypothetical protein PHISP_02662 [Aspergillus sp. HF37]